MKFSFVIINYNTENYTRNCILSIMNHCMDDYEIILVDNCSPDGSADILEKEFAGRVIFLRTKSNRGFGAGNNFGASFSHGEYLFFLNSDTLLNDNILDSFNKVLEKETDVAIISPFLILPDGQNQEFFYGKFPNLFNTIVGRKISKIEHNSLINVDWVSGAALCIRKKIFERIGGFDESFFMYFEDIDLCEMVKKLGYKIIVYRDVKVIHFGGQSENSRTRRKKMYYQSQDFYFKKHFGLIILFLLKIFRFPIKFYNIFFY